MELSIRFAKALDIDIIAKHDKWIDIEMLKEKIEKKQVYVAYDGKSFAGWLRYNLFWDNTPFMSMLHLLPDYRGKGIGSKMVGFWEEQMKTQGYKIFLTSTAQTETAQHFYYKLGYKAIGSFNLEQEPLEIIFSKKV